MPVPPGGIFPRASYTVRTCTFERMAVLFAIVALSVWIIDAKHYLDKDGGSVLSDSPDDLLGASSTTYTTYFVWVCAWVCV